MARYSRLYRLMIYFAHSTMMIYDADMESDGNTTPEELYEGNKSIMDRVFEEGKNIMNYELSYGQMIKACHTYLSAKYRPLSVYETEPYVLKS